MGRDTRLTSSRSQQLADSPPGAAAVFGAALKTQRNRTGRSLEAVSQRVGLSTSTLSRYERGGCLPSEEHLNTICRALGVSSQEWVYLVGELKQARANLPATRPKKPPAQRHRSRAIVEAIRRHGFNAVRVIVVAFALVGFATTVGYLAPSRQTDVGPDHTDPPAAASTLAGRPRSPCSRTATATASPRPTWPFGTSTAARSASFSGMTPSPSSSVSTPADCRTGR